MYFTGSKFALGNSKTETHSSMQLHVIFKQTATTQQTKFSVKVMTSENKNTHK